MPGFHALERWKRKNRQRQRGGGFSVALPGRSYSLGAQCIATAVEHGSTKADSQDQAGDEAVQQSADIDAQGSEEL